MGVKESTKAKAPGIEKTTVHEVEAMKVEMNGRLTMETKCRKAQ